MIPKFRFYHLKLNSMFEVVSINFLNEKVECIVSEVDNYLNTWRWSYGELLQSTGLFDKNGVDIYIGDILEWEMVMGHGWYENGKDVVIYDEKELRIKMSKRNNDTLNRVVAIGCKVVGNIYEHPHLLEEE